MGVVRMRGGRRVAAAFAAISAGALAVATVAPAAQADPSEVTPVVEGLDGPRGVAAGPDGRLVVADATGTISEVTVSGPHAGTSTELASIPGGFAAAVDRTGRGQTYVLSGGGGPEEPPGSGAATLYRWNPARGLRAVADIAAYQATDPDPDDLEGHPEETNPFGVAALPDGSALVADAAGNDLLRVYPDGSIVTVARLLPRIVEVPDGLPDEFMGEPLPPAGTPIPSEAVATSVTVGPDGYYYVGELRGFPATPGTSQIWRIAPGSVEAQCDPDAPDTGPCQRYADGLTSIVDLAAAPDGSLYVVELVTQSWLQWELGIAAPIGGLFRIPAGGGTPTELAAGELVLPGGVAVGAKGAVYVAGPVFGPGAVVRVD